MNNLMQFNCRFRIGMQKVSTARFSISVVVICCFLFIECSKSGSDAQNYTGDDKHLDTTQSSWRKDTDRVIKMCDSVIALYGDIRSFEKKIGLIKNKIPADFSDLKMKNTYDAMNAYSQCRKELSRVIGNKPSDVSVLREDVNPFPFKDKTLAMWELKMHEATYCMDASVTWLIWLNTCKAAHYLKIVNTAPETQKNPPSDDFYSALRDTICTLMDSFPKMANSITDVDPHTFTPNNNPRLVLESIRPFIEQAPELVKRSNALFSQGKYSSIVDLLRSIDSTFHGSIMRHTLGVLFYNYQIIDSIMLNGYESEIRNMVDIGRTKSADSLLGILENNTQFCFPSKTVSRKRSIRKFLDQKGAGSQMENSNGGGQKSVISNGSSPSFWCLYSNTFYEDDEKPWKDKKNLFYLLLKKEQYGFEKVNEGVFSSKDFFAVNPGVKKDDYTRGQRIAYLNGKELSIDGENPCIFFADVGGVDVGLVNKADIYDLGGRYRAYIPDDSIEFFFDNNQKLKFSDAVVSDSSLNERIIQCSFYIAWIGDVNRNGQIDFIIETFASQMGNRFDFIEKQNENGRTVLKSIMNYWMYITD